MIKSNGTSIPNKLSHAPLAVIPSLARGISNPVTANTINAPENISEY